MHTLPASDLPKGSQFSNSYFSDADVKQLGDCARSGSPFGTIEWPVPHPIPFPHGPVEVPQGPIHWLDAAGAGGGIKG
ncbi:MAG TPA: hypothetical protein VND93_04700 [Myxococcales bacterium]|nr:hypothetical protein [Myxococcales bacterium]